jgi:hypothetical protein
MITFVFCVFNSKVVGASIFLKLNAPAVINFCFNKTCSVEYIPSKIIPL